MARVKLLALVFAFLLALPILTSCGGSVSANSLAILTHAITSALQGSTYSATLQASGGTPPYSWSVTAGQLPTGVVFGSNGTISGVPTQSGTFNFTVSARDAKGGAASQALSLKVDGPLAITTTSLPQGTIAVAYNATLRASGGSTPYAWSVTSGSLPSGLTLNSSTGTISGNPAAAGNSNFTVRVTDAGGATQSANLTISISGLTITNTSLPNGVIGNAYQATLTASGGTAPYTWSVSAGSLPSGLSLAAGGAISGTPRVAGSSTFTVRVTDAAASAKTATFTVLVNGGLTITTAILPDAVPNLPYTATLQASGGIAPYSWSITQQPTWLTIAASTGVLSGTPGQAGTVTFTVQVRDSAASPSTATRQLSIDVAVPVDIPPQFANLLSDSTDYTAVPAAWTSPPKPAPGGTYYDPTWKTTTRRLPQPTDCAFNCANTPIFPDYSKQEAWNADGTKLLVLDGNAWFHIYDATTYTDTRRITDAPGLFGDNDVRWSNTNPDLIYYVNGMSLKSYDINTRVVTTVHTFSCSGCGRLWNGDEGNQSQDDRYWTFIGWSNPSAWTATAMFTYDLQTDTVLATVPIATICGGTCTYGINWVGMSPSGNYAIVGYNMGSEVEANYVRGSGTEVFNRDLTYHGMAAAGFSHYDVGYDVNGIEVIVMPKIDSGTYADYWSIFYRRLDTLQRFQLILPCTYGYESPGGNCGTGAFWNNGGHISLRAMDGAARGWALISNAGDPTQSRGFGATELFAIRLDTLNPQNVWRRIGRAFSIRAADYYAEPHGVPNRDFTKVLWGSNWLVSGGMDSAYVISLP